MNGSSKSARSGTAAIAAAWLAVGLAVGLAACVQVPEPLELELAEEHRDDVFMAAPRRAPARAGRDYDAWPLVDDPEQARLERREPRTYPLWPTPIDEPCPPVMFASYEPQLDGGPTFERVSARLADVEDPRLRVSPTELVLLHDHLDVPGLRLWAASSTSSSCMMGWRHTHCFSSADEAFCPDGTTRDLERLVRAHALEPGSLTRSRWLELAVVMSGVERIVIEPSLVSECTRAAGIDALAPSVEIEDARVTVRFTAITDVGGVDHTVIVEEGGDVIMDTTERWQHPSAEEPWGGIAEEPAPG